MCPVTPGVRHAWTDMTVAWKRRAAQTAEQAASVAESTSSIRTYLRLALTTENRVARSRAPHKGRSDIEKQVSGDHNRTVAMNPGWDA